MDISFKTPEGRFNYRVCGIITRNQKLLVMQDGVAPYSYLPGGRVQLHETAEDAILREMREEMNLNARIIRPLWLNQAYFIEETSGERYHEICIYFLLELPGISDSNFAFTEQDHKNHFEWIPFDELKDHYLYPEFIKEKIWKLPEQLEILAENRI